jgi:hypothetical protein
VISVCGTPKTNPMCCCMLFIFYLSKRCWVNLLNIFGAARLVSLLMSTLLSQYIWIYAGANTQCRLSFSIKTLRPTAAVIAGFHE